MDKTVIEAEISMEKDEVEIMHELLCAIPLGAIKSARAGQVMTALRFKLKAALESFPTAPAMLTNKPGGKK